MKCRVQELKENACTEAQVALVNIFKNHYPRSEQDIPNNFIEVSISIAVPRQYAHHYRMNGRYYARSHRSPSSLQMRERKPSPILPLTQVKQQLRLSMFKSLIRLLTRLMLRDLRTKGDDHRRTDDRLTKGSRGTLRPLIHIKILSLQVLSWTT